MVRQQCLRLGNGSRTIEQTAVAIEGSYVKASNSWSPQQQMAAAIVEGTSNDASTLWPWVYQWHVLHDFYLKRLKGKHKCKEVTTHEYQLCIIVIEAKLKFFEVRMNFPSCSCIFLTRIIKNDDHKCSNGLGYMS